MEALLRQYSNWQTDSPHIILEWMSENDTRTVNEYRMNANDLQRELGPTAANALATAIAPTMPLAIASLSLDAGLNFADPHTIDTLDALASAYPQFSSVVSTILGWVRQTKTRWAWTYGDMPLPSEAEIESVRSSMVNQAYDHRHVLLSANFSPEIDTLAIRVIACDEHGNRQDGPDLLTAQYIDMSLRSGTLTDEQQTAAESIVAAIRAFEALVQ